LLLPVQGYAEIIRRWSCSATAMEKRVVNSEIATEGGSGRGLGGGSSAATRVP
jgi:hypothetical protein